MANKVLSNEKNKKTSEKISDFMLKNRLVIMAASLVIIIAALAVSIVSVVSSSSSRKELSAIDAIEYSYISGTENSDLSAQQDKAIEDLKAFVSKKGITGVRANMLLASIQWQKADYAAAAQSFEKAYLLSKKSTYTTGLNAYNAAAAYEECGNNEKAAEFYQKAIDSDYEMKAHAYFNLGRVKEALGDKDGAIAAYETIVNDYSSDNWNLLAKSRLIDLKPSVSAE